MIKACCPHCGGQFEPYEAMPPGFHGLSTQQREIIEILTQAGGKWVKTDRIAQLLYAGRHDGGPLNARTVIQKQIWGIRKRAPLIDIQSEPGRNSSGYRLVLAKPAAMVATEVKDGSA